MLNIILNVMGGSLTFAYSVICVCLHFYSFCAKNLQVFGVKRQFSIRTGFSDFHDSGQVQGTVFSI